MDKKSRIAVVGAGISGLALSIALKQKGFTNIKVFEKDPSFDNRRQGYGLTILQGKSALRKIGVLE
jgi:2-polyprenyl-6-methoxyphenol hydroxylase-like FAD-dependent oxidoreductase